MADIIIRNGRIIDGAGNPWYWGDVAVSGGVISEVGEVKDTAPVVIDAQGLCVCPGFIDMHSHPDLTLFYKEVEDYKLRQGVTTEVGGNCGFTAAPLSDATGDDLQRYTAFITPPTGVTWEWRTFGEYLRAVEESRPATNLAPLVGQGTVRIAVMGFEERAPTEDEVWQMQGLVREAMEAGCFGISTGLIYVPGAYSSTEEIASLARVASEFGGFYATHMRNEGDNLLESIEETLTIGREASLPVQISHHKATGSSNHGKVVQSLELIGEARSQGMDVTVDQYPYSAASTTLQAILPPWAQEGGVDRIVARLQDPETRGVIESQMLNEKGEIRTGGVLGEILITSAKSEANSRFAGMTIGEISDVKNSSPVDTALNLLVEERCAVGMVIFSMDEDDVKTVMVSPHTMIGSDGLFQLGNPHPRIYGTYPRVLGKYVREEGVLTLEEAVRKMTSFPAQRLGLHSKGVLRPRADADIVVFDPDRVIDQGTFRDPNQYPVGIEHVLVNGRVSVSKGRFTGDAAGRVVRRG